VRGDEALLPAPADLELILDERKGGSRRNGKGSPPRILKVLRLRRSEGGGASWSHPLDLLEAHERAGGGWTPWQAPPQSDPAPSAGWFLRPAGLRRWMAGEVPEAQDFVHGSKLWLDEVRTGLGLEETTRAAREGLLYTFGFVRLQRGVGIGFEVAGSGLAPGGIVRLGGDGRTARLDKGPPLPFAEPPGPPSGGRFQLYLATPAISATGGYLPGFAAESLSGRPAGVPCRLAAAAERRFSLVGGWDMAAGRAKPLRRAIPAGSVFWLEASESAGSPHALHGAHLSDFPGEDFGRQGYGLALLGAEA
jgi:CRISPR type III-B/RAMP module-associated protein Cmr3